MDKITFRQLDYKNDKELLFVASIHQQGPLAWDPLCPDVDEHVIKKCIEKIKKANNSSLFLVAEDNTGIVAFHWLNIYESHYGLAGNIRSLWVREDRRKEGLARKLKQQGEQWAKKQNATLMLTRVHSANKRMLELNLKNGFSASYLDMYKKF